jgi:hypothetical protein
MQMNAAVLQSKDAVIEAKDALTYRLQNELRQGDGVPIAAQPVKSLNSGGSAAAASVFTPALAPASAIAEKRFRDVAIQATKADILGSMERVPRQVSKSVDLGTNGLAAPAPAPALLPSLGSYAADSTHVVSTPRRRSLNASP